MSDNRMTDNRTTELVSYREVRTLLSGFRCECLNTLLSRGINASEAVCKQNELIDEYAERIVQAIAATLGSDVHAGRFAKILHDLAEEMRNMGASTMTPHELLVFFAREIDKVADSLVFAATLGSVTLTAEQVCEAIADELNATQGSDCESRWHELFGTPERAVETLAAIETCCNIDWDCDKCPLDGVMPSCVFCGADERFKAATLEWLRGKAVER